jgi:hypothetical protein
MLRSRHYSILYSFCQVRDEIALKAAKGHISEDSNIFRLCYQKNAAIIHEHEEHGWCYLNIFRNSRPFSVSGQPSNFVEALMDEIRLSDDGTKKVVSLYARTVFYAMLLAMPVILKDALVMKLTRVCSRIPIISREWRTSAQFGLNIAQAAASA